MAVALSDGLRRLTQPGGLAPEGEAAVAGRQRDGDGSPGDDDRSFEPAAAARSDAIDRSGVA